MPAKLVGLGEFQPDLAASRSNHLTVARNVRAIANGYGPVEGFSAVTTALSGAFMGGAAFVGSDGTASLVAATTSGLQRYSGGWASVGAISAASRWRFAQFGDNIIASNGGTLVNYGLLTGTAAEITDAPTATDVATVRDFVVALGINGDNLLVGWSGFNNSEQWPMDTTNQSDTQPLLSGGHGVAIVGGEYGIILQRNAVKRMSYVGSDTIFQFDEISSEVGCMAQGSVCNVGRLIFFLSERGFMMCDGQQVTPIGDEKFNRWFFDLYSREDMQNMWSAIDPRNSNVLWAMPGNPGRVLCYNWVLQKATYWELPLSGLFTGFTANLSLEAVDLLYPGGLETIPGSLDDTAFQGGNPLLLVVDNDNVIGSLSGAAMDATVQVNNVELASGRRSRIRSMRAVTDALSVGARLNARMRAGDEETWRSAALSRSNGKLPVRANGRFVDVEIKIPSQVWSYIQAAEFEYENGDGR